LLRLLDLFSRCLCLFLGLITLVASDSEGHFLGGSFSAHLLNINLAFLVDQTLLLELGSQLLHDFFRKHLLCPNTIFETAFAYADFSSSLHFHGHELARPVHELSLRESRLRVFGLRLQFQGLVVQIVNGLSVLLQSAIWLRFRKDTC